MSNSYSRMKRIKNGRRLFKVLSEQRIQNIDKFQALIMLLKKKEDIDSIITANKVKHKPSTANKVDIDEAITSNYTHQDIENYYSNPKFNPLAELKKEINIDNFFKSKYKNVSSYLHESQIIQKMQCCSPKIEKIDVEQQIPRQHVTFKEKMQSEEEKKPSSINSHQNY